jgi:4-hydroxy-tetrahydrodipicolinate reductase
MNIAIVGYGKMGKEIEKTAKSRNHNITSIIDKNNLNDINNINKKNTDVVIEFTQADAAIENYKTLINKDIPVVSGTTGINKTKFEKIINIVKSENKSFFWASNFSIGVNIFFKLNKQLAEFLDKYNYYDVQIEEIHHIHKLDSPSGTAITIAEGIIENLDRKTSWKNSLPVNQNEIYIKSVREGEIPGTHIVEYTSEIDKISIKHEAFGRKGFATGAVIAAEFLKDKKGFYTMNDLI